MSRAINLNFKYAPLRPKIARSRRIKPWRILTLVYCTRLLPPEYIVEAGEARVKLSPARETQVTMHVLEGSPEAIEKQLTSQEALLRSLPGDLIPEISALRNRSLSPAEDQLSSPYNS